MALIKIKFIKEWKDKKVGDIINIAEDGAKNFVSQGYAEYSENKEVKREYSGNKITFRMFKNNKEIQFIEFKLGFHKREYSKLETWAKKYKCPLPEDLQITLDEEYENILKQHKVETKKEISSEVLELAKDSNLFNSFIEEFNNKRVVGEQDALKSIFLNCCGIFVKNNKLSSYNQIINSNSSAGKSFLMEAVIDIFPKNKIEYKTRISATALNYWHNSRFDPNWTWDGKILALGDVSNSILNNDNLKIMCSEGSDVIIVIDGIAQTIKVNGKPIMLLTFAESKPKAEIISRFTITSCDESSDQTKAIIERKAKNLVENTKEEYDSRFTELLDVLRRIEVQIPFAKDFIKHFPYSNIIIRRSFNRFADLIKASAALHQYQRKWINENTIEATWEDYDIAVGVLNSTTSNVQMIPLTKKQKQIIDTSKDLGWFSISDIYRKNPFLAESKWYEYMDDLTEKGFFKINLEERENSKKPVKVFKYVEMSELNIPNYNEIRGIKGNEGIKGIKGNEGNDSNNDKSILKSEQFPKPRGIVIIDDKKDKFEQFPNSPRSPEKNIQPKVEYENVV